MRHGLATLLAFLTLAFPARAQVLEKPEQENAVIFTIPQAPKIADPSAEKPDKQALAMQYLERCMSNTYQDMLEDTRGNFCMCSADAARNVLSEEELSFLATGENSGQIRYFDPEQFNEKLDSQVSAPCAYLIVRDLERADCRTSGRIQHFFVTQDAFDVMCDCLAGGMEEFTRDYARDMLAAVRKRYPDASDDPIVAIRQWIDYKVELGKVTKECLNMYSHK